MLVAASQKAPASQSLLDAQVVGQLGAVCVTCPLQKTGRKKPQSLARVALEHAESFCSWPVVAQVLPAVHSAAPMVPWQLRGSSQTGSKLPKLGQSLAT